MEKTLMQFDRIIGQCRDLFISKHHDYGDSWRILRSSSLTDQLFIKLARLRSIEEKGIAMVQDPVEQEYIGIINYSIMAMVQLELGAVPPEQKTEVTPVKELLPVYDRQVKGVRDLLSAKNHDYGEIWREMRVSSMTDLMLSKIFRIKQIEDNAGKTLVSEGIQANYRDIFNYAVFALIKITEKASVAP